MMSQATMDPYESLHFTLGPVNHSPDWYDCRTYDPSRNPPVVLGASEAGAICGVSKWKSTLELYLEKRALKERQTQSEPMKWGQLLEPAILQEYGQRLGVDVYPSKHMLLSKQYPFIAATPDALAVDPESGEVYCVDSKCTTSRMFDAQHCRERDCFGEGEDEIPLDYVMQAHQQMLVTGLSRCDLPTLFDGNKLRWQYSVRRNDQLIAKLQRKLHEFYEAIVNGEPPDPDWTHDNTVSLMKSLYGVEPGFEMTLSPEGVQWYERWRDAKEAEKGAAAEKDMCLAHLLSEIGEAETIEVPGHSVKLHRSQVADSMWTEEDIIKANRMMGQVKRRGYIRVSERKVK